MTPKHQAIARAATFKAFLIGAEREAKDARAFALELGRADLAEKIDAVIKPLAVAHRRAAEMATALALDEAFGGGVTTYSGGDDKPDDPPGGG